MPAFDRLRLRRAACVHARLLWRPFGRRRPRRQATWGRGVRFWPCLLTAQGKLYRIRLAQCDADIKADGVINVLDLIDLLLCFGQPAVLGCESEDINIDGTVNVLDLIELLLAFGTACP